MEAVQVEIDNGHFAVELAVEGGGGVGGGVHLFRNLGWDICVGFLLVLSLLSGIVSYVTCIVGEVVTEGKRERENAYLVAIRVYQSKQTHPYAALPSGLERLACPAIAVPVPQSCPYRAG